MLKSIKKGVAIALSAATIAGTFAGVPQASVQTQAADSNYAKLLQYSLYFYDANMCGTQVDENSLISYRNDCHTSDEVPGGFHDAGDHVMFGLPQGYAASTLGWSYYEFKSAYDELGQTEHFKTITNYFADYFKRSVKLDSNGDVAALLIEKGEGNSDHNYWGAPELQSTHQQDYEKLRTMLWVTSGSGDIAAEYAAALAANYVNFGNKEDLEYAKKLYNYAKNNKGVTKRYDFYASSNSDDDIAWAAGWLYFATKEDQYKYECVNIYPGWFMNWDNVTLGAAIMAAHITGDWSKVNNFLNQECNSTNYKFVLDWGSARYNASLQMCALVYDKNNGGNTRYGEWAKTQMEYLTGERAFANGMKKSMIVGFSDNSAKYPHHRAASGYQGVGISNYTTYDATNGRTLYGALVGGPTDANGSYNDSVNDFKANEVALDYNVGLTGAAAGLYYKYKTGSTVDMSSFKEIRTKQAPVVVEKKNGFILDSASGNTYYYVDDKIVNTSGFKYAGGKWAKVVNGIVDVAYTGLVYYGNDWWYVTNGYLDKAFKGVTPMNGKLWFIRNGKISREDGSLEYNGERYWITNGAVDTSVTELKYWDGIWYYFRQGKVDWTYNTLAYSNNRWWYVHNGILDKSYTGLVPYSGKLWYVTNGVLDKIYASTCVYQGKTYNVANGIGTLIK